MKLLLTIEGMSCGHCSKAVNNALSEAEGIGSVSVDLEKKSATIEVLREMSKDELKQIIDDAGYELVEISTL